MSCCERLHFSVQTWLFSLHVICDKHDVLQRLFKVTMCSCAVCVYKRYQLIAQINCRRLSWIELLVLRTITWCVNLKDSTRNGTERIHPWLTTLLVSHAFLLLSIFFVVIWSLSTRVFEVRTANGDELFSLLAGSHTTTFTLLSIFSPSAIGSIKSWETIRSWHAKCSLPVAVRVSKTRVFKLPIYTSYGALIALMILSNGISWKLKDRVL